MSDFFLEILDYNEGVDYALIISIVVGYLLVVWFVVCTWVFADSRQRYESFFTSVFLTIVVFLLGPPFLMIYILIRPEHTLEEDYYMNLALSGERELKPIQFDGDKGFDFNLNISVEPKKTKDKKHEMNMNIAWIPQSYERDSYKRGDKVEKEERKDKKESKSRERINRTGKFISTKFKNLGHKTRTLLRNVKKKINDFHRSKEAKEKNEISKNKQIHKGKSKDSTQKLRKKYKDKKNFKKGEKTARKTKNTKKDKLTESKKIRK